MAGVDTRAIVAARSVLPRARDRSSERGQGSHIEMKTGEVRNVTLVCPREADMGGISVLAPVGAALIGLSVGQTIELGRQAMKHETSLLWRFAVRSKSPTSDVVVKYLHCQIDGSRRPIVRDCCDLEAVAICPGSSENANRLIYRFSGHLLHYRAGQIQYGSVPIAAASAAAKALSNV